MHEAYKYVKFVAFYYCCISLLYLSLHLCKNLSLKESHFRKHIFINMQNKETTRTIIVESKRSDIFLETMDIRFHNVCHYIDLRILNFCNIISCLIRKC